MFPEVWSEDPVHQNHQGHILKPHTSGLRSSTQGFHMVQAGPGNNHFNTADDVCAPKVEEPLVSNINWVKELDSIPEHAEH